MRRHLVAMLAAAIVASGCGTSSMPFDQGPANSEGVVVVEPNVDVAAPATVTVPKAERWKQGKGLPPPEKGNTYVAVLIKIEALADADYSPYYTKVRDADGFEYDWLVIPAKEPSLGAGELAPGDKVQGWVTFEVPSSSVKKLTLVYDSIFGEQIQIPLTIK